MQSKSHISVIILTLLILLSIEDISFAQKKRKEKKEEQKELTKYEVANAEYLLIDAQKYFLLEDYKKAEAFLQKSLEIDKENDAAYFKLAEIYMINTNTEKGLDAINKALSLVKDNKYYYLLAAQLYKQKNDLPAAANAYEQMVQNTSDYHDYLLDMSDIYTALKRYDDAITAIENTEKKFGKKSQFTLQKVSLMLANNQEAEAVDLVREMIDDGSDDEELILEYTKLVANHRSVQQAIDFLEERERTSKMEFALINFYLDINQLSQVIPKLDGLFNDINVDVESKLSFMNQLLAQPELNKHEQTLVSLQEVLENTHPNTAPVLEMSGKVYSELSQFNPIHQSKAIESYLKVKDLDPSNFNVWDRILTAEYEAQDWSQLVEHSNEALDLYPNQGIFYFYNGAANLGAQNISEASDALKQASKLAFNNPRLKSRILSKQGVIDLLEGNQSAAFQKFESAIGNENFHPEALNTYGFQLALRKHDMAKALDLSAQLIRLENPPLEYLYTRGFVLFQSGQFEEAERILDERRIRDSGQAKLLELYGDVLFKLNKAQEALEQWQKAKDTGNASDKIDQKIANKQYYE